MPATDRAIRASAATVDVEVGVQAGADRLKHVDGCEEGLALGLPVADERGVAVGSDLSAVRLTVKPMSGSIGNSCSMNKGPHRDSGLSPSRIALERCDVVSASARFRFTPPGISR